VAILHHPQARGRRPRRWQSGALTIGLTAVIVSCPATARATPAPAMLGTVAGPPAMARIMATPESVSPDPAGGGRVSLTPNRPAEQALSGTTTEDRRGTPRRWLVLEQLLVTAVLVLVAVALGRRQAAERPARRRGQQPGP
jgi:hypothetical protein